MKKATITIFAILIFLALIGAGCQSPFGKNAEDMVSIADYRKGNGGFEVKVSSGMPKEIPEFHTLHLGFDLENMGPSEITDSYVKVETDSHLKVLDSIDDDFTQISNNVALSRQFTFMARSPLNPAEQTFAFLDLGAESTLDKDSVNSEIKITACYDYSTYVTQGVCVDPKQYQPEARPAACKVQEIKLSGGQGAPVAVTGIKPSFLYEDKDHVKPYFDITIENIGSGDAFSIEVPIKDACSDSELGDKWNKVKVIISLSNEENRLKCWDEEETMAHLKDGKKAVISCSGDPIPLEQPAYTTPLFINLIYGYTSTKKSGIKILNLRQGLCLQDYPMGSKCNDVENTLCGESTVGGGIIVPGFKPDPVPTKDCAYGCCIFTG